MSLAFSASLREPKRQRTLMPSAAVLNAVSSSSRLLSESPDFSARALPLVTISRYVSKALKAMSNSVREVCTVKRCLRTGVEWKVFVAAR